MTEHNSIPTISFFDDVSSSSFFDSIGGPPQQQQPQPIPQSQSLPFLPSQGASYKEEKSGKLSDNVVLRNPNAPASPATTSTSSVPASSGDDIPFGGSTPATVVSHDLFSGTASSHSFFDTLSQQPPTIQQDLFTSYHPHTTTTHHLAAPNTTTSTSITSTQQHNQHQGSAAHLSAPNATVEALFQSSFPADDPNALFFERLSVSQEIRRDEYLLSQHQQQHQHQQGSHNNNSNPQYAESSYPPHHHQQNASAGGAPSHQYLPNAYTPHQPQQQHIPSAINMHAPSHRAARTHLWHSSDGITHPSQHHSDPIRSSYEHQLSAPNEPLQSSSIQYHTAIPSTYNQTEQPYQFSDNNSFPPPTHFPVQQQQPQQLQQLRPQQLGTNLPPSSHYTNNNSAAAPSHGHYATQDPYGSHFAVPQAPYPVYQPPSGDQPPASAVPPYIAPKHVRNFSDGAVSFPRNQSTPDLTGGRAPLPVQNLRQYHQARSTSWTPDDFANAAAHHNANAHFFPRPHPVIGFGFGGRVCVLVPGSGEFRPSGRVKVTHMTKVLENTPVLSGYTSFPGPLTSSSSKDAVVRFVSEKVQEQQNSSHPESEASRILWELLRLLCANHGSLSGDAETEKSVIQLLVDAAGRSAAAQPHQQQQQLHIPVESDYSSLAHIQQLLLSGNRKDACRTAMDSQLWAHALLLAYGSTDFLSVMTSFATSTLPEGSPLRTLYLVLAQQHQSLFNTPQAGAVLERWCENLAAILSTTSAVDRRPIMADLGDRLWANMGKVEAAHICYLLADLPFGTLDNQGARIIVLGGDHKRRLGRIAACDSIQRSEIYEYAHSVSNSQYSLPSIHPFKLLYAWQLIEVGLIDNALRYVQQLMAAEKATKGSGHQVYSSHYLYQLHTLDERLRGHGARNTTQSSRWFPRVLSKGISLILGDPTAQQPITVSSAPPTAATQSPVKNRTATSPESKHQQQAQADTSADDYADAFSTTKKEPAAAPTQAKTAPKKEEDDLGEGDDKKWFKWWGKKGKVAKLGDQNQFEYNAELKMWVEKGKPLPVIEELPPPPPADSSMMMTTPPDGGGGGGGGGGGAAAPDPNSPIPNKFMSPAHTAGGRRKPRYFDSLNQTIHNNDSAPAHPTLIPRPGSAPQGGVRMFTPESVQQPPLPTLPEYNSPPQQPPYPPQPQHQ